MANKIYMDTQVMHDLSIQITGLDRDFAEISHRINTSLTEVRRVASGQERLIGMVAQLQRNAQSASQWSHRLSVAVKGASDLWEEAERIIAQKETGASGSPSSGSGAGIQQNSGGNAVFDPSANGRKKFGGDQGAPVKDLDHYGDYRDIIEKNTGKRFKNNKDLRSYLKKMNSEGCGYVAMVNTIMSAYEGRADAFKETFGYDMYDADGNPNYNMLLVDIYSATDNRNPDGSFNKYEDFKWGPFTGDGFKLFYDPWTDTTGSGTSIGEREQKIQSFLNNHNVTCDVQTYPSETLTADAYNRLVNNGTVQQGQLHIRVGGDPVIMRDANGNAVHTYSGGHAMTVTGTTDNGMLQVSSWGETYYIDPSDLGKKTSMGYQIVHIQS